MSSVASCLVLPTAGIEKIYELASVCIEQTMVWTMVVNSIVPIV